MYPAYNISLPRGVGISLKPKHFEAILDQEPAIDFFEIHPENYMSPGGLHLSYLEKIAERYPISMHGVGMSPGSANGIDDAHLQRLAILVKRFQPIQVSEHLSWSHWHNTYLNDLLPLPYTEESLSIVARNVETIQDTLQRPILIENPSAYLGFKENKIEETQFLNSLCEKTGCGLLLDLNNIIVSAFNNEFNAKQYLSNIKLDHIGEVHLAGHKDVCSEDKQSLKIDDHGSRVGEEVWDLLEVLINKKKEALPLLVEWDTDIPELSTLTAEANKARNLMLASLENYRAAGAKPC